jgi:ankyrin repeat protein
MDGVDRFTAEAYDTAHPVFWACAKDDVDAVRQFLKQGTRIDVASSRCPPLPVVAVKHNAARVLELLLDEGVDPNMLASDFGENLLTRSLTEGKMESFHLLLRRGANPAWTNKYGASILHGAAASGNIEAIRVLLDHKVPVEMRMQDGSTPFYEAARANQVEAMQILSDHGANIDAPDDGGETPLIIAAKAGCVDAVRWLLQHGADLHHQAKFGRDALYWAKSNNRTRVIELLEEGCEG